MAHTIKNPTIRDQAINIRATRDQRDLIDQAARALGKSRSEFMLDVAAREAENVLLDQVLFRLNSTSFDAFLAMLDAPSIPRPELVSLLNRSAPWE